MVGGYEKVMCSVADGIRWLKREERQLIVNKSKCVDETDIRINSERLFYVRSIISMLDSYDKVINVNNKAVKG